MDVESIETDFQIVNCYFVNVRVSAVIGIFNGKFLMSFSRSYSMSHTV